MDTFLLFPPSVRGPYTNEREAKRKYVTYDKTMPWCYALNSDANCLVLHFL